MDLEDFMLYSIVALNLFIAYKSGFVREDEGHILTFFTLAIPFFSLLFYFDEKAESIQGFKQVLGLSILIGIMGMQICFFNFGLSFQYRYKGRESYLKEFFNDKDSIPSASILPKYILSEIGHNSVDVLPFEISLAYFNHLNYNPRPVFQSYQAYSGFLDSLNAYKYNTKSAPDFLIFTFDPIDGRLDFWDETKTKISILNNYTCVDSFKLFNTKKFLLLKKTSMANKTISEKLILNEYSEIGKPIGIPKSNHLILMKLKIEYSLIGKLRTFFYHSPIFYIDLKTADGRVMKYHAIKNIVKSGIIINKGVYKVDDFYSLISNKKEKVFDNDSFSISSDLPNCFEHKVDISFFELKE